MITIVNNINNKNKIKANEKKDSAYKITLMLLTSFVVFMILLVFSGMIINGLVLANENGVTFIEAMFGKDFVPGIPSAGVKGLYGVGFIIFNTLWMSFLSILIAAPISISTAIFITRVLTKRVALIFFSVVAILAAIPSVIYGAFAKFVLDSFFVETFGTQVGSLMVVVFTVAFMVMPTITIMTITSINNVDSKLEDSSLALGATKIQTSIGVTLKAAKSGIILGILFAVGRTIGEATAISMVYIPDYSGITLSPFNTSLFLSPLIMSLASGFSDSGAYEFEIYLFLTSIMLITVIFLFVIMKKIENSLDEVNNSKKQSKIAIESHNTLRKIEENGFESLTNKENQIHIDAMRRKHTRHLSEKYHYSPSKVNARTLSHSSLDQNNKYSSHKRKVSLLTYSVITLLSLIGILLLFSILKFVFIGGFKFEEYNFFTWEVLSSKGIADVYNGSPVYGLAIPILGTFTNVIVTLLIGMPIGIVMGLYFGLYLNKDSFIGKFISISIQVMTSIPAVVYGAIAVMIFAGTSINKNAMMLEPMIMLAIVILPTVIKQTEDGVKSVKTSQIEGSLGLGATRFQTTKWVYLKQIFPSILTASLLSISIVMAESAIFLTLFGTMNSNADSLGQWMSEGGNTLALTIFKLSTQAGNFYKIQMRSVAAFMMLFVLAITLISQLVRIGNFRTASYVFGALIGTIVSIQIGGTFGFWLMIICILTSIIASIANVVIQKRRI